MARSSSVMLPSGTSHRYPEESKVDSGRPLPKIRALTSQKYGHQKDWVFRDLSGIRVREDWGKHGLGVGVCSRGVYEGTGYRVLSYFQKWVFSFLESFRHTPPFLSPPQGLVGRTELSGGKG